MVEMKGHLSSFDLSSSDKAVCVRVKERKREKTGAQKHDSDLL